MRLTGQMDWKQTMQGCVRSRVRVLYCTLFAQREHRSLVINAHATREEAPDMGASMCWVAAEGFEPTTKGL